MNKPDVEVDTLLEGYRLSHSRVNVKKGEKRPLEEEEEQERDDMDTGVLEDNEDDEDVEDGAPSRKRQKRSGVARGAWQELEGELEVAGTTLPEFPIALEFTDTELPFRFKS